MFTFFIGKGGVGKTTVSSAYALHRAAKAPRQKILLLSTDPAHSLADVLQKSGDSQAATHERANRHARSIRIAKSRNSSRASAPTS